jgi:adenylate cyclase
MSFIAELKRRNVIRMALLYAVASWVLLQIADVLFEPLGLPEWTFRLVLGLLLLGFPLALIFAWVFEMTPASSSR